MHEINGVGLIENREVVSDSRVTPEAPKETMACAMKRAAVYLPRNGTDKALHAREHFLCGTACERQQQNPVRTDATLQEVRDTMDECAGLSRSCARDDQERAVPV
jgi:hypothetical protein